MTLMEAVEARHSVRRYTDRKISGEALAQLRAEIEVCRHAGNLHIELCLDEAEAMGSFAATYGLLRGVRNYIVLAGEPAEDLEERAGYYGEILVLRAQQLGLNTCWVGGSFRKGRVKQRLSGEMQLVCVIAVGYGANQGKQHRSKPLEKLYRCEGIAPEWFISGMKAAQLAPTAINQQRFLFELRGNAVSARALPGLYSKVDLGIVKLHFEIGAGKNGWHWA